MIITEKLEKLLKGNENKYRLVVLASQRTRELNAGTPPLVESEARKNTSIALEEVIKNKVKGRTKPRLSSADQDSIPKKRNEK